jgi:hypothetical protein
MELSLSTVFFLLVAFAVGAAIIMFMIGQWLDLTGVRYKMESQRNALNLIQLIVSTSPLVYRDPYLEPNKLILDVKKLNDYNNFDMYDQVNFGGSRYKNWNNCCIFPDYDYEIYVYDLNDRSNWHINPMPQFKTDIQSQCYPKRVISYADLPVIIRYENGEHHPGFINITLTKTPLSDLSSWLSQGLVRVSPEWNSYKNIFNTSFEITVLLDPEIKSGSIDKSNGVCLTFRDSGVTKCKQFQTTDATLEASPISNSISTSCYKLKITIDPENNKVVVS